MSMRLKLFVTLSILLASSCKNGPEVTVCISRPLSRGFVCVDPKDNVSILPFENSDKMIAFSPGDAQKIIESCGINSQGKAAISSKLALIQNMAEEFD